MKHQKIQVNGTPITIVARGEEDYISLTDIARHRDAERSDYILQNWLRNRSTIEFIGLWEQLHNPEFNSIEFDGFKNLSGSNSFSLTPKRWIESTNAIGVVSKAGRYGGTFAHRDIAFEFASWISPEFKLYLITEFQRLKRVHTDAIKDNLIPRELSKSQINLVYAKEADLLNVALFGTTAKQWRDENPTVDGNIRDFASIEQLVVLSNLESINAILIQQGLPQSTRLQQLNGIAITQMTSLMKSSSMKRLK